MSNLTKLTESFSITNIENYINQNIPLLVVIWLAGLLFFSLRFAGGLIYTYRMRSRSQKIGSSELNGMLKKMSQKIGLRSKVQIKETSLISTPMVIGFIKPIILLPLGMANGLSLHQVEAILFHEIAHIYRLDYFVNLIQSIVEVVLFYHPVVWWLSAHIRAERENICDDIAIKHTGSALNYAKALTDLQELNNQTPDIVVAFSNKKYRFMNRIRRLLGLPLIENNLVEGFISSLLLIVSIVLFTTHAGPVFSQANEESSINIEHSTQLDKHQEKKGNQKDEELKEYEHKLTQVLKENMVSFQKEKQVLTEIEKKNISKYSSEDEYKKSGSKELYELRIKYLDSDIDHIKECQKVNATVHYLDTKKEKIKNLSQLQQQEHKKFMAKQAEIERAMSGHHKITQLSQMKQNMTKDQQKKMQYEFQQIEEFQQKNAQFLKQSSEELKKKRQYLKQMQLEMEKNEPSEEQKAKLKTMEKELAIREAKLADKKKIVEMQLRDMESKLKDKITDMREIDELEEDVIEVKKLKEEMMAKEIEMAEEVEIEMEQNEDLRMARQADSEMVKKEMAYKKTVEIFAKNLIADGLMKKGQELEFVLTAKELEIDGKKQPKKLFKKYTKLVADTKGEKLKDGKKFILNF